jgi:hypothetical protein
VADESTKGILTDEAEIGGERNRHGEKEKVGNGEIDDIAVGDVAILFLAKGDEDDSSVA